MVSVLSFSADWQQGADAYNRGDCQTALKILRPLAMRGNALSQVSLGEMYRNGHGVTQSDAEAVKWYRKSAEQGDARGQNNLGWMYDEGRGVAQSDTEVVEWHRKADEQSNAPG